MKTHTITLASTKKGSKEIWLISALEPFANAPMSSYLTSVTYGIPGKMLPDRQLGETGTYDRNRIWEFIEIKLRQKKWNIQSICGKPVMNIQKEFVMTAFESGFNSVMMKPVAKAIQAQDFEYVPDVENPTMVNPHW